MENDELLTVAEIAAWLRITPRTVYRFIRHAQLPDRRVGAQYRFLRREVDAWLRRREM
jgi:excisionase family DNA binding protein